MVEIKSEWIRKRIGKMGIERRKAKQKAGRKKKKERMEEES